MHQRVRLLAGIAAVFASSIGCAMEKKESSPDPGANTAAPSAATATTTAAAVPAGDPDKSGAPVAPEKSGEGNAAPAPSADEPKTATKVTKGAKEVKTDGKAGL